MGENLHDLKINLISTSKKTVVSFSQTWIAQLE